MTEGLYWSEKLKTTLNVYKLPFGAVCLKCGKKCSHPIAFTRIDDEDVLEYVYGPNCIKSFKLELIETTEF